MNLRFLFCKSRTSRADLLCLSTKKTKSGNLKLRGGETNKMTKLTIKIATAVSSAALVVSSLATPLLATTVEVSGNGADSSSTSNVTQNTTTTVNQTNDANIHNNVDVKSNTGGNDAKKNTGGDTSIKTGDSSSNVTVNNTANQNVANVQGCCPKNIDVKIAGNGADSNNDATVKTDNKVNLNQDNTANIDNYVKNNSNTGDNEANKNTGGDVSIKTGASDATVKVSNNANANWAAVTPGANGGGSLSVLISGNGAGSDNGAAVTLNTNKDIDQDNLANISNNVDVKSNTGDNDAKKNTGGNTSVETGDATAKVNVSTLANFNAANIEGCGCVSDLMVKVAGNGADSSNDAVVNLDSMEAIAQDNTFSCGNSEWGILSWNKSNGDCAGVKVDLNSGNNDVKSNTNHNGDPSVTTGDASSDVTVDNTANKNVVGGEISFPTMSSSSNSSLLLMLLAMFS